MKKDRESGRADLMAIRSNATNRAKLNQVTLPKIKAAYGDVDVFYRNGKLVAGSRVVAEREGYFTDGRDKDDFTEQDQHNEGMDQETEDEGD